MNKTKNDFSKKNQALMKQIAEEKDKYLDVSTFNISFDLILR